MSATIASSTILLSRILSLKEICPFILSLDTVSQSAHYLTTELVHKARIENPALQIIYLSFETTFKPKYLNESDQFYDLLDKPCEPTLNKFSATSSDRKRLIIVDSFNYVNNYTILMKFLASLIRPENVVYGVYHLDVPEAKDVDNPNMPTVLTYLKFLSNSVIHVKPVDLEENDTGYLYFPIEINQTNKSEFCIDVIYRRKSGRSLEYKFKVDSTKHDYSLIIEPTGENAMENEELLEGLTTFNLNTTDKQKVAREKVDLPYLEAQKSLGSIGGSIVYEFEKDDDYDEDDPYEDPF